MSGSTPGPWRLDDAQRNVLALKVKCICEVPGSGVISTGVDQANARLIAAAPDLLAALVRILDFGFSTQAEDQARSAVTLALRGKDS